MLYDRRVRSPGAKMLLEDLSILLFFVVVSYTLLNICTLTVKKRFFFSFDVYKYVLSFGSFNLVVI